MISPISTMYKGTKFRTKTEAKYAVYFDELGVRWEYEPEAYIVSPRGRGGEYCPSFLLHIPNSTSVGIHFEIKDSLYDLDGRMDTEEKQKKYMLACHSRPVFLITGSPGDVNKWFYWSGNDLEDSIEPHTDYRFCVCPGCDKVLIAPEGRAGLICTCKTKSRKQTANHPRIQRAELKARNYPFWDHATEF